MIYTLLTSLALNVGIANATPHHKAYHKAHRVKIERSHSHPVVSINWVWVLGHYDHGKWIRGHWRHPDYGISYRARRVGPPSHKDYAHSRWIPGHWEGHPRNRHWVEGRWSRR